MPDKLLQGIRVLDLTQALAGPYCTMILGDLGSDVIKVEKPGRGDDTRHWGPPFVEDESAYFMSVNHNKRSAAIDLKSKDGLNAVLALASRCDVVVENFRPGVTRRLGLGPEQLRGLYPRLVYCSISGFGQDGAPRAGYDQIVQGTAGLMSITGFPDGPPVKLGVPISDIVAGMFGAHSILAALYARERSGTGTFIDVAIQDSVIALLTFQAGRFFATGKAPERVGNHHPTIAPYGTFETMDGYLNVCVGNDSQWVRFCDTLGLPSLASDELFDQNSKRVAHKSELHAIVEPALRQRRTSEWLDLFESAGVPAGAIRSLAEVFDDDTILSRGMQIKVDHPIAGRISVLGAPWRVEDAKAEVTRPPPLLGQHTREVLIELAGYSTSEVEALANRGSVQINDSWTGVKT